MPWGAHEALVLFVASIGFNFAAGRLIHRFLARGDERAVWRTMWVAVAANLLLLFFWKYATFAVSQLDRVLGLAGSDGVSVPHIALPIGISFFTFHGISYIVDITRGDARPLRGVADYAQYMAFFPQLSRGRSCATARSRISCWSRRRARSASTTSPRASRASRSG